MKTIFKFPLPPRNRDFHPIEDIEMPRGAWPISAAIQVTSYRNGRATHSQLVVWAIVEDQEPRLEQRRIAVVGTGREVPADARFLSTVQDAPYVWHVFDLGAEEA